MLRAGERLTTDVQLDERDQSSLVHDALCRNKHSFKIAERGTYGGKDEAPSPFDLLCASLAGCSSMTLRLFAQRRGMALPPLSVRVLHRKMSATDAGVEGGGRELVDLFELSLSLRPSDGASQPPSLSSADRALLLDVATKCPVHHILAGNPRCIVRARWSE